MGRSGPGVLDLLSSIGLRAPYTKTAADWKASEDVPVKEFYMEKIPKLCELHFTKTNEDILRGPVTRDAATALFEEYGPRIWSRVPNRPWLFNPGEITKHAPYTKKLYFDNPEDNEFLKGKIRELVIERIFRHHKDNIQRNRSVSVDGSWRLTPVHTTRSARTSTIGSTNSAGCFSTAFGLAAHQDASSLQEQGIWLGDYNEENEAVNGPSWNDVTTEYFFQTDGGARKGYEEPYVFEEATETTKDYLHCAACLDGALLEIECHEFTYEDEDNETIMTKNVWTYPCKLGDRKVFALIKQMPQVQSDPVVWGFWKVDGGYTTKLLLASRTHSAQKRVSEAENSLGRSKKSKQAHAHRHTDAPTMTTSRSSIYDNENLYESTPRPARANATGFFRPYAHSADDAPAAAAQDHTDAGNNVDSQEYQAEHDLTRMILHRGSQTIRQESTLVSWAPGQNVVLIDDNMDVWTVYARIQRTMNRKLEGKELASVSFVIHGEVPIDVEIDDEDAWETVLELVKEAGLSSVKGSVSRSD